jgi:hypothetical protein
VKVVSIVLCRCDIFHELDRALSPPESPQTEMNKRLDPLCIRQCEIEHESRSVSEEHAHPLLGLHVLRTESKRIGGAVRERRTSARVLNPCECMASVLKVQRLVQVVGERPTRKFVSHVAREVSGRFVSSLSDSIDSVSDAFALTEDFRDRESVKCLTDVEVVLT